jgi:hypothetical protein
MLNEVGYYVTWKNYFLKCGHLYKKTFSIHYLIIGIHGKGQILLNNGPAYSDGHELPLINIIL